MPSDNRALANLSPPNRYERFAGKAAIVTGAGSGIGLAVTRALLDEGAAVLLLGRTASKLELARAGAPLERTRVLSGRHERLEDVRRAVEECQRAFGGIDILINNAGEYLAATVAETDLENWHRILESNLTGPFLMARAALPALRASRGVVINVASTLGLRPVPGAAAYAAAKAGLIQLTRSLAVEEAAAGVRACVVCPGVVDTPIHSQRTAGDGAGAAQFLAAAGNLHPLGRVGQPGEVAAMILFLASAESAWTTGAVIPVDGGIALV